MRIVAAGLVIVSHSIALVGHSEPTLVQFGVMRLNLGSMAVATFFVLSGFMISASWQADAHVRAFVTKRAFRIWPALIAVVLLSALVMGPLLTTLSTGQYFSDPLTWHYSWTNITMHPTSYALPGVFADLPFPVAVNGPLWTLPYEVTCYVVVLLLGVSGLLRRPRVVVVAFVGILFAAAFIADHPGAAAYELPVLLLGAGDLALLAAWFMAGVVLQRFHRQLDRGPHIIAAAVTLLVVGWATQQMIVVVPCVAFLVVWVGTHLSSLEKPAWMGDPSYGMYLWGWPIQQLLMSAGLAGTSWVLLSLEALPLAVLAGIGSWYVVERRSISVGRRLLPTRARRPDPGVATSSAPAPSP